MTDAIGTLWLAVLQDVFDLSAHEVKDSLNGVSLNLEVIRSRSARAEVMAKDIASFAAAASGQFETLSARVEAMLALARPPRASGAGADVAPTIRHLATLLVPAARAEGRTLIVKGDERPTPVGAPLPAVRLAIASGLMALLKGGSGGTCTLESAPEPVVRFSHESAASCSLDPMVADAIAEHKIRTRRSGHDLLIVFPGP